LRLFFFCHMGEKSLEENHAVLIAKMRSQVSVSEWIHVIAGRNISSVSLHVLTKKT